MRKTSRYIIIFILILSMVMFSFSFIRTVNASGSILKVGEDQTYQTIQSAIMAASDGDTIFVYSGTYYENIIIDKKIFLTGEDKDSTTINGSQETDRHTINIYSNNVSITGFTIKKAGLSNSYSTIRLNSASNCTITNNIIKEGWNGIYLGSNSNNNEIKENTIQNNNCGIYISNSKNNIIKSNIIENNNAYGIQLSSSSTENIIYLNEFYENNLANAMDYNSNIWSYNSQGNHWDDYNDYDSNNDGIGDNPYIINSDTNSQDDFPLGIFLNQQQQENQKPIATITSPSETISEYEGEEIFFQGHGTDPDSGDYITAYNWRSNKDGFLSSEPSFTTSDLSINQHIIYFKVKDNHGLWSNEKTVEINILENNQKPIAVIMSIEPNSSYYGETIVFRGYGNVTTGNNITAYSWTSNVSGMLSNSNIFSTSNLTIGKHSISFEVKDNQGLWSDEVSKEIEILKETKNPPVALTNGPYNDFVNNTIIFDGSNNYDEYDSNISYFWDFGDGNTSNDKITEHSYSSVRNYTVTLTVTNKEGYNSTTMTYANISYQIENNTKNDTTEDTEKKKEETSTSGFEILILLISLIVVFYYKKTH